ncbi:hypothetical protein [Micromonospora lupini]|uniref:hypothetical protein n=1 Tax=Micromonospora lupini TaxID=285679 RepID=UPI0033C8F071
MNYSSKARIAAAVMVAAWTLAVPTSASAAETSITGATAYDWDYGHRVTVCDNAQDSRKVMSEFYRNDNDYDNVQEAAGSGNCEDSSYGSSLVHRFNACRAGWGSIGWGCGNWRYTGY